MAFRSELRSIDTLITEDNYQRFRHAPEGCGMGRESRNYSTNPFGTVAEPFNIPVIPRSEWKDRIEEMERTKTRLSDIVTLAGIEPKNQGQTNYCWCNAVITAIETLRASIGLPYVKLSPASVAAPIKNFRNQGGWGGEALDYIIKNGVASVEYWPANAISREYQTAEMKANALLHMVTEWYELRPRNFDEKMTCLLLRLPVPSGYNWMGHEMCSMDPMYFGGNDYGARDRNSWGQTQEWYVMHENRATPDDAVVPRVTTASTK